MNENERLIAIEDISLLKARYFRFVDTKDWSAFRKLFSDDALLFYPESMPEWTSIDEVISFIPKALDQCVSIHHGFMPEIEVLSGTAARAIWPMEDRLYWATGQSGPLGFEQQHGFGHYHEEYRKTDDQWQITRLKLTRLRLVSQMPVRAVL